MGYIPVPSYTNLLPLAVPCLIVEIILVIRRIEIDIVDGPFAKYFMEHRRVKLYDGLHFLFGQ